MTTHPPHVPQPNATNLPTLVESIDLHPQARQRAQEYIDDFRDCLMLQSKSLALTQKANVVLSTHVDDARQIIRSRAQDRGRLRAFLLMVGSAMFGTFLQGFPIEMATEPMRKHMIVFNVCAGIIGSLVVSWSLREKVIRTY